MAVAKLRNFDPVATKQAKAYRLFCLHGENEALVRDRAAALRAAFAAEGSPPAIIDLDGDTLSREPFGLADEIGSMSLFADRRILRVALAARDCEEAFANALPALARAEGVLVVVQAGTDKRQEGTIRLLSGDSSCLVIACPLDSADDLADFASRTLGEAGMALDDEAAAALVELTDGDRSLLANELAKLLLLGGQGDPLSAAVLRGIVADEAGALVDEAAGRVLAGDVAATLDVTDRLALAGGDASALVGAALRKALWDHRNASGRRAADLRRAIARLNDAVLVSRSNDRLAGSKGEMTLIRAAQFFRR